MNATDQPSLEELRRARGEGWQWPRVASEACPQCGLHPRAREPDEWPAQLRELAHEWREFLTTADDDYLRTNPAPGTFSPIQYGAHVRDIFKTYIERIELAMVYDSPTVPQFNPPDEVWMGYNQLGAEALADDLETQARQLATRFGDLEPADRSRIVTRDGGRDGVFRFSLADLVCYAVHEAHHHLLDANGTLEPAT
jgi:hypothetical protein